MQALLDNLLIMFNLKIIFYYFEILGDSSSMISSLMYIGYIFGDLFLYG